MRVHPDVDPAPRPRRLTRPVNAEGRIALGVVAARRRFDGADPVDALDGVDLEVRQGSITAVLGPSGCGKSTLLRVVAGTERLDAGRIEIDGTRVVEADGSRHPLHVPPEQRRTGLVPQEGALFPHLDVAGNVAFGIHGMHRDQRRARVRELLELVDLVGYERRRPHELSGGERQRVALARALAPRPAVVLLDEPFSALDATLRAALRDEVADLLRSSGSTAVIVTHDRTEAMAMADEVAVMRAGRIVQRGRPDELYRRPVDEWTGRFLGDAVVLHGRAVGSSVECVLGTLAVDDEGSDLHGVDGREVTVLLRPEQIVPAVAGSTGASAARVGATRFLGPDVVVDLMVGETVLTARWPSSSGEPAVGEELAVTVRGAARAVPAGDAAAGTGTAATPVEACAQIPRSRSSTSTRFTESPIR